MNAVQSIIKCSECYSVFTQKKNLYAHIRKFHDKHYEIPRERVKHSKCDRKIIVSHHVENDHTYRKNNTQNMSRLLCAEDNCSERFFTYNELRKHLTIKHDVSIEVENHVFDSLEGKPRKQYHI